MARVILCTPPWSYGALAAAGGRCDGRRPFGRDVSGQGVLPTLGLHYLATSLTDHGHEVRVVEGYRQSREGLRRAIVAQAPDVVGVSVQTALWQETSALLEALRERAPDTRLAVGGAHATLRGRRLLDDCPALDAVFAGPAEDSFRRWVERGRGGERGMHRGEAIAEHPPGWGARLGARISWEGSLPNLLFIDHPRFATSVTSVGCARRCAFCAVSQGLGGGRARPNAELLDELSFLAHARGVRTVNFMDDDPVFARPGLAGEQLLREMIDRRLELRWTVYLSRFDVAPERLALMRRAGCRRALLMIESGAPRILRYVKGHAVRPEDAAAAAERVAAAGIEACARFQFGFPGERWEDGLETLRLARRLPLTLASFLPAMLYPGSRMAADLQRAGRLTDNERRWSYYGRPFVPDAMSPRQQAALVRRGVLGFYGRPRGLRGLLRLGRYAAVARRTLLDGAL